MAEIPPFAGKSAPRGAGRAFSSAGPIPPGGATILPMRPRSRGPRRRHPDFGALQAMMETWGGNQAALFETAKQALRLIDRHIAEGMIGGEIDPRAIDTGLCAAMMALERLWASSFPELDPAPGGGR